MAVRKTSVTGGEGGDVTIGPPSSGLSISGGELSLSFASASTPGAVSTATQHLAGAKIFDTSVGIGTTGAAGQALHVANGNLLVDGASENAYIMKRSGVIGLRTDPIFSIGRIIAGGVNEPVFRWMYEDASHAERQIMDIESTGTFANIMDNTRRSMFESYRVANTVYPTFRLNDDPDMQFELGPGGSRISIGGLVRTGGTTVTATCQTNHGFGTGQTVHLSPGEANFASGDFVVTVTGATTFTYSQAGSNVSSTALAYASANSGVDTVLRRNGYASLDVRLGDSSKVVFYTTSLTLQDGVALSCSMASGSNAINLLNGARLNFSTGDASAYLYRSASNTIRTPGAFTADGALSGSNLSGTNTGDITLAAVGSSPSANGASLSAQVLTLQPADGSTPGLLTATTQTIGGAKTFSSVITSTIGASTVAVQLVTNSRLKLGGGTVDYLQSDGTNLSTPAILSAGSFRAGNLSVGAGTGQIGVINTSAAVKCIGNMSDGASAIGVVSDNDVTLSNATSKIHSFQNNTSEKASVMNDGAGMFGGTTISTKAMLQADSTTKGFLPPRMTTTQRDAITSPPAGLTIFNSTTTKLEVYDGTTWQACW